MSIEIRNVTKRFQKTLALDSVTAEIREDKIYGILGRNGAGKSTLLNIISNRIIADDGEILIDGEEAVENNKSFGGVRGEHWRMCAHKNGTAVFFLIAFNYADNKLGTSCVARAGGFVKQKQLAIPYKQSAQRQPLQLTARKGRGFFIFKM